MMQLATGMVNSLGVWLELFALLGIHDLREISLESYLSKKQLEGSHEIPQREIYIKDKARVKPFAKPEPS